MKIVDVGDFLAMFKDQVDTVTTFEHIHDTCELDLFVDVRLGVALEGRHFDIRDGDVLFIDQFRYHRFRYDGSNRRNQRYVLNFSRSAIQPLLQEVGKPEILDVLSEGARSLVSTTLKDRLELEGLYRSLVGLNGGTLSDPQLQPATRRSYVVLLLLRLWDIVHRGEVQREGPKRRELVQEISEFLDREFARDLSLDSLARDFLVNKYHLGHVFKEGTGRSVMGYVQERRLDRARGLLETSTFSIGDIAQDCGYHSPQSFYRAFRAVHRCSPAEYRRGHRG